MTRRYFVLVTEELPEGGHKAEVHPVTESQVTIRPDTKHDPDIWGPNLINVITKIGKRLKSILLSDPQHKQLEED